MKKEASSGEKKRSLFWIGLIVLVIMMGALGWQAKSLLQPPEPTPPPASVRAKVPPVPPPTTIQIPQPATAETIATQNTEKATPRTESVKAQKLGPSGQTSPKDSAPDSAPKQSATKTTEPMVAKAQGSDKNSPQATDQTEQAAEDKSPPLMDQPKAKTPASGEEAIAEKQSVPASVPTQAAAKQVQKEVSRSEADQKKPTPYTIQVGAFRVRSYAIDKLTQLAPKGYDPYIYETKGADQKPWYGVRFGHFETRAQATQALSDFKKKEKMDGIISRSDSL